MTVYRALSHLSHTFIRPSLARRLTPLLVLLGLLIAVVCGLVVLNAVAGSRAEAIVEREVEAVIGAPVQAQISGQLSGLKVLAGRLDRLDLQARQVPIPDSAAVIDLITAELTDVHLTDQRPSGGTGTFEAWLSDAQVRRAVPTDLAPLISLGSDALDVDLGFTVLPLQATVSDGSLQFVPSDDLGSLVEGLIAGLSTVPLQLPPGIALQDAEVIDGRLRLAGTVDAAAVAGE